MPHSAWSETVGTHIMEEDLESNGNKVLPRSNSILSNFQNQNFFNSKRVQNFDKNGLPSNSNFFPNKTFTKMNRNYYNPDEIDSDADDLTMRHIPSSETVHSRGSRTFSQHSPPGSFRSMHTTSNFKNHSTKRENDNSSMNIIILIGFAIGIVCGKILKIAEVYLKWFELKLIMFQMYIFNSKSFKEFYMEEESMIKKIMYSPISAMFLISQSLIRTVVMSITFLLKPAPKTLVSNVLMRYINE